MVKKLLTIIMGLGIALGAQAQWPPDGNPVVYPEEILFWCGTGTDSAVIAVTWNDAVAGDIGIAWGVRWNGSINIGDAMDTIATYDPRFTVQWSSSHSFINTLGYADSVLGLDLMDAEPMRMYNWKDADEELYESEGVAADILSSGDFVDWLYMDPENDYEVVAAEEMLMATPVVSANAIKYWIGQGSNSATFTLHFNQNTPNVAFVWGFRWDDSDNDYTVEQMMEEIAAADDRVELDGVGGGFLNSYGYTDNNYNVSAPTGYNYPGFIMNNTVANMGMASMPLADGDNVAWCDAGYEFFSGTIDLGTPTIIYVSEPTTADTTTTDTTVAVVDATIAASDILYWVGEGSNEVVFAVNWADTALAWGYRFGADCTTVAEAMDSICAADWRLSYTPSSWGLDNIVFFDSIDSIANPTGGNWMSTLNGNSAASVGMGTVLHNGDFFKWGDYLIGTLTDPVNFIMVFTDSIYAVSIPTAHSTDTTTTDTTGTEPEHGPFCGAVGTEGCNAISADSSAIVAWATGIVLNRGPQNISIEGSPAASYGTEADAIGQATTNNMRAVSLGDGGTATITFARPIRNGEGPDFAVFENGFANISAGNYSLELAFVEVSTDGERFVRFPATSLTQTEHQIANAGSIDPTMINNLAGKFQVGYGTPFDLAELADSTGIDIDSIVYVRLVDVVGSIDSQYASYDAFGHIVNDPWPTPFAASGYDLTGVAVMYEREDVVPVEPAAEDASIAASDIIYWVGEGGNEVVFAINWADSALAWGYRFATDSVVVGTIISDIVEADPRLSIEGDPTFVSNFIFTDSANNVTLSITPHDPDDYSVYFNMQVNHVSSMLGAGSHMVGNGDFVKFADTYVAVKADSTWIEDWGGYWDYTYVWPYTITPVSEPGADNAIATADDVAMSVYPNPATGVVNIIAKADTEAILFDMAGRSVMTVVLREGRNTLDLSSLQNGIYMLRTAGHVEKIIKK